LDNIWRAGFPPAPQPLGSGRRNDRRRLWRMTLARNRKFADSPLERAGFELPVRGRGESGCHPFCAARLFRNGSVRRNGCRGSARCGVPRFSAPREGSGNPTGDRSAVLSSWPHAMHSRRTKSPGPRSSMRAA